MRRRTFLLAGLGAGGALFFGWSLTPPRQRLRGRTAPDVPEGTVALNGWLTIAPDDTVTIVSPKAEMGQGIHTALAMLIAEELDVEWSRVRVTHAPIDAIYNNVAAIVDGLPIHSDLAETPAVRAVYWLTAKTMRELGVMMTGGSSSVRDCWEIARQAGATARQALLEAAAARAGVEVTSCRATRGVVHCGARSFRYGELLQDAAARRPTNITLKAADAFSLIGTSIPRLDSADKSRGVPLYGIDVRVDGLLYAAVAMPPALGATVVRFNAEAARARRGVRAVVPLSGSHYGDPPGVAVIADSWWRAKEALTALAIEWTPSPHATLSSEGIRATLQAAARTDDGLPLRSFGDAEEQLTKAARTLDVLYDAPYLAHATMEPMNATVRITDSGAELWCGTQVPGFARAAVAHVAQLDEDNVTLHQQQLGGGFGRRLEADYAAQATAIAKAVPGVPVQMIWSRENDLRHDFYRPAAASRLRAGIDAKGQLLSVVAHSASQAPFKQLSRRVNLIYTKAGLDKTTAEGTFDQPYEFPALRSAHAEVDLPVPVGSWRSVGHSHQAFFFESFLDEIAAATSQDPLAFRLQWLSRHPRAAAVLRLAAERSGWGTATSPAADGQRVARGIALHHSFATLVAHVAEVSISPDRQIRLHRVVCAVDCGLVVNPSIARQQIEGSIIDGWSVARAGEVRITDGRVVPGNFQEYPMLRIAETPLLDVHFVPSAERPSGVGEPALPGVAPAVANAVFALTGERLRQLPLRLPERPEGAAHG